MYKYRGFGLCIASEVEFPELLPAYFPQADITIALGRTPEKLEGEQVIHRAFSSITKDEYLLSIKNICKYYVGFGNTIIAEPEEGMDINSIRLFLLSNAMAAILYQRGSIPLHASAIVKDGKLVLFAGNSGAGKSTLLAGLATKGYEIFTDDICVLQQDVTGNGSISGAASYPMIKLWEDALEQIDNADFNKDFKIREHLPKYGQFFYDKFNIASLHIDKIFILNPGNTTSTITVQQLPGVQAFKQMEKQAYRYQLISNTALRSLHFSLLSQLISEVPIFEVARPIIGSDLESLLATIEKYF